MNNSLVFTLIKNRGINFLIKYYLGYIRHGHFIEALRAVKTIIMKRLGHPQLRDIFICPSHECNANCVHCYEKFIHEKFKHSLTTEQVKDIIDQFHKLGGFRIYFCSGEFLLREDAIELIRYARSKHIIVWVVSNGLLLNENKIDSLKRAGLRHLVVSIDSADPERHDKLRGVPGCFEKATQGLRIARKKGFNTYIWTYVSKNNFDELDKIAQLGKKLGIQFIYVFFTLLSGKMFESFEENLTLEDKEYFRDRFNSQGIVQLEFPTEDSICMGGGFLHLSVMASGDVTFCPPVPYSYGNIKTESLKHCFLKVFEDHKKFCTKRCTGQCIVNFPEYRENCNATFIYN